MNKYSNIINLINKRLGELSNYENCSYSVLLKAERYSLLAGGKHLRALILMQVAALGGVCYEKSVDFACALEMVHTYSLVHDDLPEMDNDELRRGKPTCHKKFGSAIALLAGDALLTKAFDVIASSDYFDDKTKLECIKHLAGACGENGMLAGQVIDKISENTDISYDRLLELHNRKTGDMFLCAVNIGAALAKADSNTLELLQKYISNLGIAFQIKDDILDVTSSQEVLGKPINSDACCGKSTFVSMFGIEKSEQMLMQKIDEAKVVANTLKSQFLLDLADFFAKREM